MSERQNARVIAAVGVILKVHGARQPCMTRNISRGGMFVLSPADLGPGDRVEIEIIQQGQRLTAVCQVATRTAEGLGLTFAETAPGFDEAIDRMIGELLTQQAGGETALRTPDHQVLALVWWSRLPDGKGWRWWRKTRHSAEVMGLSLDGAALISRKRPEVGEIVLVYLEDPLEADEEPQNARAEVVRHTERGFAVSFDSPGMEFRRTVSRLRRRTGFDIR